MCYDYWENYQICNNCISIRAHLNNQSFIKIEKNKNHVFWVNAIPVKNAERPVVLELLKDAADTMMIGLQDYINGEAFENFIERINDAVVRDFITTLYNRRFVDERLPADVVNSMLEGTPLSVCFIDLDSFKQINDLYGHRAGDLAIKAVGAVLAHEIRSKTDWAARYGGDEFLLSLRNTNECEAQAFLQRVLNAVEKLSLDFLPSSARLSFSYGIKTTSDIPLTADDLIQQADDKMYMAKRAKKKVQ
jgi:diguanylate cyclase (GGDEF)-like protein